MKKKKWGYIRPDGTTAIPFKYDIADPFSEGMARVKQGEKSGFIYPDGTIAVPFKYDKITDFISDYAIVECDGLQGLINRKGKEIYACQSTYIDLPFRDGVTIIKQNGKYGYIDEKGRTVLPCKYDSAGYFINGRAEVTIGEEHMFIDLQGNIIDSK